MEYGLSLAHELDTRCQNKIDRSSLRAEQKITTANGSGWGAQRIEEDGYPWRLIFEYSSKRINS